jgi:hypothetical protein
MTSDISVDESILGFILKITQSAKYDFSKFLSDNIHEQLVHFQSWKCFRYQSYLIYLMLYHQSTHFQHLALKTIDQQKKLQLVFEWTQVVRDCGQRDGFKTFVDKFMATTYTLIHNEYPPRMFPECKIFLQLSPQLKYGDWYIF